VVCIYNAAVDGINHDVSTTCQPKDSELEILVLSRFLNPHPIIVGTACCSSCYHYRFFLTAVLAHQCSGSLYAQQYWILRSSRLVSWSPIRSAQLCSVPPLHSIKPTSFVRRDPTIHSHSLTSPLPTKIAESHAYSFFLVSHSRKSHCIAQPTT